MSAKGSKYVSKIPDSGSTYKLRSNSIQLGAGGSIIANAGFIKQFGNKGQAGVRALDPTWGKRPIYFNLDLSGLKLTLPG